MQESSRDQHSLEALQSLLQFRSRGRSELSALQKETPKIIQASNSESTIQQEKKHRLVSKDLPSNNKSRIQVNHKRVRSESPTFHNHKHNHQTTQHEMNPQNLQQVLNLLPQQQSPILPLQSPPTLTSTPNHHQQLFFPSPGSGMPMTSPMMSSSSSSSMRTHNLTATALVQVQLAAARTAMAMRLLSPPPPSSNQQQPVSPPSDGSINLSIRQQTPNPLHSMDQNSTCTTSPSYWNSITATTRGNADTSNTCSSIRREKVEAALRSKPQRGKKRDDLSAKERLELTRTRNREHAKTTRIRKKARYQELLECEAKLETLLQQEETEKLQRKVIETFVSLRQSMIRCCQSSTSQQEEEGSDITSFGYDYEQPEVTEKENEPDQGDDLHQKVPSASNSSVDQVSAMKPTKHVDHASILDKLVHNVDEFHLQVSPKIDRSIDTMALSSCPTSSLSAMKTLVIIDQQIVDRATQRYGVGAPKHFCYQVSGDGIALTKNNSGDTTSITAMAKIELYMEPSPFNNKTRLQICLLKASFDASQSLLLKSVEWTVLQDSLLLDCTTMSTNSSTRRIASTTPLSGQTDAPSMETNVRDSSNPLQSQSIFPSVVSLEQSKTAVSGSNTSLGMML